MERKEEGGEANRKCERKRERESARARKREGSVVGRAVLRKRRRSRRGKLALVTAMGVPLLDSCEVKSLPWF